MNYPNILQVIKATDLEVIKNPFLIPMPVLKGWKHNFDLTKEFAKSETGEGINLALLLRAHGTLINVQFTICLVSQRIGEYK